MPSSVGPTAACGKRGHLPWSDGGAQALRNPFISCPLLAPCLSSAHSRTRGITMLQLENMRLLTGGRPVRPAITGWIGSTWRESQHRVLRCNRIDTRDCLQVFLWRSEPGKLNGKGRRGTSPDDLSCRLMDQRTNNLSSRRQRHPNQRGDKPRFAI